MDKSFILNNFKGGSIYSFIGGGGKTSMIKEISEVLSDEGYDVIVTTTTKFGKDEFIDQEVVVSDRFNNNGSGTKVIISEIGEKKLIGFDIKDIEGIDYIPLNQVILIEADGSRRMPVKVPYGHEPVIPSNSKKVFLVFGGSVMGEAIDESNTYNIDEIKKNLDGEVSYDPVVFKKIIEKNWIPVLGDFNTYIFFNQGDMIEDRDSLSEILDYFKVEYGVFSCIGSVLKKEIYYNNIPKIGTLILAAGEGKRMGAVKQLLKIGRESFLENVIKKYNIFSSKVVVTLGYHKKEIRDEINEIGFSYKEIEGYMEGMGSSLREGYKEFSDIDGLFVTPCDLPLLSEKSIKTIIEVYIKNPGKTILPKYKGKRGHPVLFPFEDLKLFDTIKGDEGARNILKDLNLLEVEINDPGIIADIDTKDKYVGLKEI